VEAEVRSCSVRAGYHLYLPPHVSHLHSHSVREGSCGRSNDVQISVGSYCLGICEFWSCFSSAKLVGPLSLACSFHPRTTPSPSLVYSLIHFYRIFLSSCTTLPFLNSHSAAIFGTAAAQARPMICTSLQLTPATAGSSQRLTSDVPSKCQARWSGRWRCGCITVYGGVHRPSGIVILSARVGRAIRIVWVSRR
jgi:hypothetical protein